MKKIILLTTLSFFLFTACEDDNEVITDDTSQPSGKFMAQRSGTFVAQNGTGTTGMTELGIDADGEQFIKFGQNFQTNPGMRLALATNLPETGE